MKIAFLAASAVVLALGGCVTVTPSAPPAGAAAPAMASAPATSMGSALNAARAANGLPALVPDAALMAAARQQASFMARTGTLTHGGPGGSTVGQRVRAAGCGWSWVGENVHMGAATDAAAMQAWMQSPGHRANALNRSATAYGSARVGAYRALVLAAGC